MSQANGQSVRSDVLDAVVAALGENAYRCRFRTFAVAELPAENVLPNDEDPEYDNTMDVERRFRFDVRHTVAAIDGAEKVADARYVRAYALLQVDPTLGGLVKRVVEVKTKWEMEQAEQQLMALVVTYEAEFSTSRSDPSVAGY